MLSYALHEPNHGGFLRRRHYSFFVTRAADEPCRGVGSPSAQPPVRRASRAHFDICSTCSVHRVSAFGLSLQQGLQDSAVEISPLSAYNYDPTQDLNFVRQIRPPSPIVTVFTFDVRVNDSERTESMHHYL